jgi:hypothetical protein
MVSSTIEPPLWTLGNTPDTEPFPTTLLGWQAAHSHGLFIEAPLWLDVSLTKESLCC